ncbi:hypothetical protein V2J09_000250 [Rumex salicifolius]
MFLLYIYIESFEKEKPILLEEIRYSASDLAAPIDTLEAGLLRSPIDHQPVLIVSPDCKEAKGAICQGGRRLRFLPEAFGKSRVITLLQEALYLQADHRRGYPERTTSISKATILGIALGALVILLMILVAACRPHHPALFFDGSLEKPAVVSYTAPKLVILHMNMALHVYDDIMRMTENLSEKYIIGHGASSTVYKCVLKNCKSIAIKKLYAHYPHSLKEFETELETVGSIKHRNLVSLKLTLFPPLATFSSMSTWRMVVFGIYFMVGEELIRPISIRHVTLSDLFIS